MRNLNEAFYNNDEVVKYYAKFNTNGLFSYEQTLIDTYFKKYDYILDIGCGTGRVTKELNKQGFCSLGIDSSESMIRLANKMNVNAIINDVTSMTFASNTFDSCIFSFNGLMLITSYEERCKAINEISRVTKKHGIFIFTTPFLDNKINNEYWISKINSLNFSADNLSFEQKIQLSDEILEDNNKKYYIHVPFLDEVHTLLKQSPFKIITFGRRLDDFSEEIFEEELDDNYYWVVKNEKN